MISFITPSLLPIQAALTMGVSAKADDAIGRFGTGLKYAIAGILRLGGEISLSIGIEHYRFTTVPCVIRNKTFQIVHCNKQPCGFTTELGKHWEPWQLFRELASNTLDEGGRWQAGNVPDAEDTTVIRVKCHEVEESEQVEHVFMPNSTRCIQSYNGAEIRYGASRYYYYKGIRAGSFPVEAPVTINVLQGRLSEDRLLDQSNVQLAIARTFATAEAFDTGIMDEAIASADPSSFWHVALPGWAALSTGSPAVLQFLLDRRKYVAHPVFRGWLDRHLDALGSSKWSELPMTPDRREAVEEGERLVQAVGIDPVPRDKVHFTADLRDGTMALTMMDTRHVWFSSQATLRGRDEWLATYLEEATHAMTGEEDCTRGMQNLLFSMIVRLGLRRENAPC